MSFHADSKVKPFIISVTMWMWQCWPRSRSFQSGLVIVLFSIFKVEGFSLPRAGLPATATTVGLPFFQGFWVTEQSITLGL
jgi:hypothetical protein